jgi:hypothetical protein
VPSRECIGLYRMPKWILLLNGMRFSFSLLQGRSFSYSGAKLSLQFGDNSNPFFLILILYEALYWYCYGRFYEYSIYTQAGTVRE